MIPTPLDEKIASALKHLRSTTGEVEFEPQWYISQFEGSARDKARHVLASLHKNSSFRGHRPIFLSIGGGDGAEIDELLRASNADTGIVIEGNRKIATIARNRRAKLEAEGGKRLDVWEGDAGNPELIENAMEEIVELIMARKGDFVAVTCHAVIHELFDRSETAFSPAEFFGTIFSNYEVPIWFRYREPGVPANWRNNKGDVVRVIADCNPSSLVDLANEIRLRHSSLRELVPGPRISGDSVRLHADLAMELIAKLLYLENLAHEMEERVTAGQHFELVAEVQRAIRVPANVEAESQVLHEDFPSDSFSSGCQKYGVRVLVDDGKIDLGVPQSHTLVTAWRLAGKPKTSSSGMVVAEERAAKAVAISFQEGTSSAITRQGERVTGPFDVAVDGMTVNCVGELIVDDPQTGAIRRACRESYRACVEDFAFAAVYGTRLLTSRSFRPSISNRIQPGVELITQLGVLAEHHELVAGLAGGALLLPGPHRTLVSDHLASLADSVNEAQNLPFFKDWMMREASKYLGDDPTLFCENLPTSEYKFNVTSYYKDTEFQSALPELTVKRLASFIPRIGQRPFAERALSEFVTQSAVSLVTIMLEYDLSADAKRFWRLPHVLRRTIKRQYWRRHGEVGFEGIKYQGLLRGIIVRHALATASTKGFDDRSRLIPTLLNLRDEPEIKETRTRLQDLGLLHIQAGKNEDVSRAIVRSMYRSDFPLSSTDSISLGRSFLVFRRLKDIDTNTYERGLFRAFPELDPRG